MSSKKNPALNWKLYCIIDAASARQNPAGVARALFKKGVGAVQLRHKNAPSYELIPIAKKIARISKKYRKAFIVNDRLEVALASGASGLHLGLGDMPLDTTHKLLGSGKIIGRTVHSLKDAKRLGHEKITYMAAGHVFPTPSKEGAKPRGIRFVKNIKGLSRVPVFAIGGINVENVKSVMGSGADGVCVVRAARRAKNLLRKINDTG